MNRHAILMACVTLHCSVALAAEPGLVADYAFDEGGGTVAPKLDVFNRLAVVAAVSYRRQAESSRALIHGPCDWPTTSRRSA